ncbi:MAG: methylated-DNA--[protein]-cysteine S-methyltransferase [Neorhizobium sp.]|nr:methylated-DNA--[protein]-cysteine S-methyltransferase [Neorhizobium sp.]
MSTRKPIHHYCIFETVFGFCGIAWVVDPTGLPVVTRFQLASATAASTERLVMKRLDGLPLQRHAVSGLADQDASAGGASIAILIDDIRRYFGGAKIDFSAVAVDLSSQDDVFRQIYAQVLRLPWGVTTTYGALARALGAGPEKARDVGQAMAKNPIPLIIPCHRVLAAGNKIGGFSAPGGSVSKARMLELEGVVMAVAEPAQQSLF